VRYSHNISLTDAQKGYIAGFIDGEGYFSLSVNRCNVQEAKRGFTWHVLLVLCNTNFEVLKHIKQTIGGGSLREIKASSLERARIPHKKPIFRLTICSNIIRKLLPQICEYLIVKKEEASLVMKSLKLLEGNNGWQTKRDDELLKSIYTQLRKLRRKARPLSNNLGLDQPQVKES